MRFTLQIFNRAFLNNVQECDTTSEEDLPVVGFTRQFPSTRPEAEY